MLEWKEIGVPLFVVNLLVVLLDVVSELINSIRLRYNMVFGIVYFETINIRSILYGIFFIRINPPFTVVANQAFKNGYQP